MKILILLSKDTYFLSRRLDNNVLTNLQNFQSFVFSFLQVGTDVLNRERDGKKYIMTHSHYARKNVLKRDVKSSTWNT
ncbi:MAG: hypothetical protein EP326_06325 [Deltaproteobacteria bacterium]|nr:MAG: hypothetical protein EP326_06325 [Deltaproteobacteria bacterium]